MKFAALLIIYIRLNILRSDADTIIRNSKITVSVSQNEPFAFYRSNESHLLRGMDISILDNFARKFNWEIKFIPANISLRRLIVSEDKISEMLGNPWEIKADLFVGGLEETIISKKYLISSQFYHYDYITWCVAKSKPLPFSTTIFRVCNDPAVIIIFAIQVLYIMVFAYVVQVFERPQCDWNKLVIFGIAGFCGLPIAYNPKNDAHRFAFMSVLIGDLIFVTTFLAYFMNFATNEFYATQIQSIPEILSKNFILAGDEFSLAMLSQQKEIYGPVTLQAFKPCNDVNICLDELKWNENLAVAVSYERIQSSLLLITSQIYCFDETQSIHKYYLRFLINKKFQYLSQLNEFIRIASHSGLASRWLNENRIKPRFVHGDDTVTTGVDIISGIWMIIVALYSFCIIIFFWERFIYKKARQPRAKKHWIIAEMIIDSNRYFLLNDLRYLKK